MWQPCWHSSDHTIKTQHILSLAERPALPGQILSSRRHWQEVGFERMSCFLELSIARHTGAILMQSEWKGFKMIKEDVAKRRKQKGTLGNKPGNQFCLSLNFLSLVREATASSKINLWGATRCHQVIPRSPCLFLAPSPYPSLHSEQNC